MSGRSAEVVVWGAGIAGVAATYHLAVRRGMHDVVLVDERTPLSLTIDKSTECYRNWWPGPGDAMVAAIAGGFSRRTANRSRPEFHRLRLRLLQPEAHVHLAIQRHRGGQVRLGLFALSIHMFDHRRHVYIMIAYSIQMLRRHIDERHLSQAA